MAVLALQSAATGLTALNTKLDVIAHNLANVNTTGFKASRANFQDLMYVEQAQPGVENAIGDKTPTGLYVGLGVKVSGTQLDFREGATINTGRPLDVRINGKGFFRVEIEPERGSLGYTRSGNFAINADGELVLANDQGRRLTPRITLPANVEAVQITNNGEVLVRVPGQQNLANIGQIELANFVNPAGLEQIGENLFVATDGSGDETRGAPGEDDRGALVQGVLEGSNVDPTLELIDLIRTQRAFEMNSQAIRAADETLRAVGQLRR